MITVEVDEDGNPKSAIGIDDMVEAQLHGLVEEHCVPPNNRNVLRLARAAYRMGWAQCGAKAREAWEPYGGRFDSSKIIGMTEHGDKVYAVTEPKTAAAQMPGAACPCVCYECVANECAECEYNHRLKTRSTNYRPAPAPSSGVTLCDFHEDQVSRCIRCEPGDALALLQRACSQYRKEAAEWEAKYNELRSSKT